MGALVTARIVTEADKMTLARLPEKARWDVLALMKVMNEAAESPKPRQVLADASRRNSHKGKGWKLKTLETMFYRLRGGRFKDGVKRPPEPWDEVLINRAKAPKKERVCPWMTPAVIEWWRACCDRHKRSFHSAWLELVAKYKAGEMIGDVDWRRFLPYSKKKFNDVGNRIPREMPLPPGWSYHNLMKHKPRKIETAASRHGRHEAIKYSERVHTTRANLLPGQRYEVDDMWMKHIVTIAEYPKVVRPLSLRIIDVASDFVFYGLKPRMEDEDGKRQNLTQDDMLFALFIQYCDVGFHKDGNVTVIERGWAKLKEEKIKLIETLSGGKIKIRIGGIDRVTPYGQWGYTQKGNPDAKAHIEGSHNLLANRLDDLPGHTGSNSRVDKPEEFDALEKTVKNMLIARAAMEPGEAAKLRFPVMDWKEYSDAVEEAHNVIFNDRGHALEGWENRMKKQWRALPADDWKNEEAFHDLPPEVQRALVPAIQREDCHRLVRMTRREVWEAGKKDLVKLPAYVITMLCPNLLKERPCPPAEIIFEEKGARQIYRVATCKAPDGAPVELRENKVYKWIQNPLNARELFVCAENGAFLGTCEAAVIADRGDEEAVKEVFKTTREHFNAALSAQKKRGVKALKRQTEDMAHNAKLLAAGEPATASAPVKPAPISAARLQAAAEITLDDLTRAGAQVEGGEWTAGLSDLAGAANEDNEETTTGGLDDLL